MIYPANFFGLTVYPGKAYTTVLEDDTHLTMAAVTSELGKETGRTSVILTVDGNSFTLCSLTPGKIENQPIDIYLTQDEEITFTVKGNCPIDLTGNVVAIIPPEGFDEEDMVDEYGNVVAEDEEIDSDEVSAGDEEVDENGLPVVNDESDEEEITEEYLAELKKKIASGEIEMDSDEMDEDEEDLEEDGSEGSDDEEEMEFDAALVAELKKRKMAAQPDPRNEKKAKIVEIVEKKEKSVKKEEAKVKKGEIKENVKPTENKKDSETKKSTDAKKKPEEKKETAPKDSESKKETKSEPLKKTLPSGLVMEDSIVGTGPRAKSGHKVSVRYIGKLTNGKVFDSNTKGAPFSFKLGKGQVIKGWDMGVQGMNVGGTRKLTIPAPLAYGKQGCPPDIPKNATLEFEVKLLALK